MQGQEAIELLPKQDGQAVSRGAEQTDYWRADDQSGPRHRRFIGYLGLLLPATLWFVSGWRATKDLPQWQPWDSISDYYYSGSSAFFTGTLCALAVFLFTYRGYQNEWGRYDRHTSNLAAWAALGVAIFPTQGPVVSPNWWTPAVGRVHFGSAVVLFCAFGFFSLVLFRKSNTPPAEMSLRKRRQNAVYLACGIAIFGCILWAAVAHLLDQPIFWPETLALELFAISWLTKGRSRLVGMG